MGCSRAKILTGLCWVRKKRSISEAETLWKGNFNNRYLREIMRLAQENEEGPKRMKELTKIDKDAERQLCLAVCFHSSDYIVCGAHV